MSTERDESDVQSSADDENFTADYDSKESTVEVAPSSESVTFTLSLPTQVRATPEHEAAVSIDDVAVTAHHVDPAALATTSFAFAPAAIATTPTEAASGAAPIPELPPVDRPTTRRGRQRIDVRPAPETATMLTAERLINQGKKNRRPAPEGFLQQILYALTFHLVNVGDSYSVRERKALEARITKTFSGGTRFVPVLTRKGGVGKTTITALLGMALADTREDRIIAIDANPDRGTLAERIDKQTRATVRDVVMRSESLHTFSEFQTVVSRDETRLDVLASDTDPHVSEAFDENDYNIVADMAERFYSVAITDCGTGIVHSVMRATLQRADSIVIVSGGSVDEARLASETLTWLESNGHADLVKNAVVALNTATQGTNLVKLEEIEAHFKSRVREVVRVPYDASLATGSVVHYRDLNKITKNAARELAAVVMDGLDEVRTD
ncbi:MinD-like ATPase involved in chromosome partitioning or flagellar assembly [Rhodoglobus vestalii]|uniref:MinD-like ATPase involved in chromosome partitioning or flagellar assembly n=1 Tax=Rhodoglobus vestalii TaxID=193384 RepID=A0A8H2PWX3_9MICO|nr:MinD/ParA family protein [Rhodoglobus vestalii]TQO18759.1 MinD-like ATPase involved in chromosome partitioning or flagellar assembly [Rhodoglobus vestalii]